MIRFKRIFDVANYLGKDRLAQVAGIYQKAFPYHPSYAEKIVRYVKNQAKYNYETILIAAEGRKSRVLGFSLCFLFPDLKFAYLDYIAIDPQRSSRGIGAALYEVTKEFLLDKGVKGMLMDVPPDDEALLKEKSLLSVNKKRLKFYESFGARPIINTAYEKVETTANAGYFTYLVYDPIKAKHKLRKEELKQAITKILAVKANIPASHPKLKQILASIKDDPLKLREPIYKQEEKIEAKVLEKVRTIDLVVVPDTHSIHHIKERGYVERPARVSSILKGLGELPVRTYKPKKFSDKIIEEVHDKDLLELYHQAAKTLTVHKPFYPDVYPKKFKQENMPKDWSLRAGFHAMDSFTPLTANVYQAAKNSAQAALTAAELVLKAETRLAYALCRPPGHHASKKYYGGFCYFNNAALAVHQLSKDGKVAFIDIDYHHGNGSQEIFYERNDVYFISIHGNPVQAYPYYAGYASELGSGKGKGFNRNFPLAPGTGNKQYLEVVTQAMDIFKKFKPKYLVVSLGLDLMKGDPTGTFTISPKGMRDIGEKFGQLGLPTLVVQEGGYSLSNLKPGAKNFLLGLSLSLY